MNLKDAAANLNQAHPEDTLHPLYTPWGELLMRSGSYDDILSEYPRPQMRRTDYHMLNGLWEYAFVPADGSSSSEDPAHFTAQGIIRVPFSPEALLSRVHRRLEPTEYLWYHRELSFSTEELSQKEENMRCILHFDAVDQEATVFLGTKKLGTHSGAGEKFNINSPKQLGVILFEKMKLPFAKKTKTGYSTSADILDKLRTEDPIIPKILEYRQVTKLKSTYADGLPVYIEEDGRIHGKFNQTITATGRISSTDPNLQNIPIRMELGRQLRKVFTPREGWVFLDADYSQIELRVLAHLSGDQELIEAYRENKDIHRSTASKVFHIPFDEVTDLQRRNAKAVNFGIVYGISSFGLGQDLNVSRKEAEHFINQYFETYPAIKTYLDGLVDFAKTSGYAKTMFGRRRPVPELSSGNFMQRSFGERVAMNSPIQGTAADIIKIAMIRVSKRLLTEGLEARVVLQVHDELLVEAPPSEVEKVGQILHEEMAGAADLLVPLEVEVEQGSNWYEAH